MIDMAMASVYAAAWIGILITFGLITFAFALVTLSAIGSALWLAWLACVAVFMKDWT